MSSLETSLPDDAAVRCETAATEPTDAADMDNVAKVFGEEERTKESEEKDEAEDYDDDDDDDDDDDSGDYDEDDDDEICVEDFMLRAEPLRVPSGVTVSIPIITNKFLGIMIGGDDHWTMPLGAFKSESLAFKELMKNCAKLKLFNPESFEGELFCSYENEDDSRPCMSKAMLKEARKQLVDTYLARRPTKTCDEIVADIISLHFDHESFEARKEEQYRAFLPTFEVDLADSGHDDKIMAHNIKVDSRVEMEDAEGEDAESDEGGEVELDDSDAGSDSSTEETEDSDSDTEVSSNDATDCGQDNKSCEGIPTVNKDSSEENQKGAEAGDTEDSAIFLKYMGPHLPVEFVKGLKIFVPAIKQTGTYRYSETNILCGGAFTSEAAAFQKLCRMAVRMRLFKFRRSKLQELEKSLPQWMMASNPLRPLTSDSTMLDEFAFLDMYYFLCRDRFLHLQNFVRDLQSRFMLDTYPMDRSDIAREYVSEEEDDELESNTCDEEYEFAIQVLECHLNVAEDAVASL
jgi:hypothetical protein